MSTPMDHIAYLSQEIGPRPAGTEEEQQAALYITDRFQKEAHLSASIEDFSCNTNPGLPKFVCNLVTIVAIIVAMALPVAAIPAIALAFVSAAVFVLESLDKPIASRLFMKGVSQNVIAKYEPVVDSEGTAARRRKVIVVANYDSGKVRRDLARPLVIARRALDILAIAASILIPFALLIRTFAAPASEGPAFIAFVVILALLGLLVLIPAVFFIMEKAAAYNEAANHNASGVAVMLEVARRLGNGEASGSPLAGEGVMHDEQTAYAAGVVPDGATVAYETGSHSNSTAAKTGVAGLVSETARGRAFDIAGNLVQVKEAPLSVPGADDTAKTRKETRDALPFAPEGTLAAAAAKAAELRERAEEQAKIAEEQRAAEEGSETSSQDVISEPAEQPSAPAPSVPDWYKKATEKARSKAAKVEDETDAAEYRSRYATYPDEHSEDAGDGETQANAEGAEADAALEKPAEPAEIVGNPDFVAVPEVPAAKQEQIAPGATTAMPPVADVGNLDLDALRAAAQGISPAANGLPPQEFHDVPSAESASAQVEVSSSAETTRLPQMKFYTPPADRSDVVRDRAQKERVVVSANELEDAASVDAAQFASQSAASLPAFGKMPLDTAEAIQQQSSFDAAPRVISANIPVVDIPPITLPAISAPELKPVSFEEFRQRAPLAAASEAGGKEAAKNLLASTLPSIGDASSSSSAPQNSNVSLTGSFSAVGAIGSTPVGDELVENIDPADRYVDDADDSVFEEEFTETGAFAGPGYVEMPQSRVGKFFGRFRNKKKKDEGSPHEWLGVDEEFNAREAGRARGGWESFRDDDWEGGAFSNLRARVDGQKSESVSENGHGGERQHRENEESPAEETRENRRSIGSEFAAVADLLSHPHVEQDEIHQIYSFASGDINTEVWFVALGSELADHGGIKAFLAEHAADMRGALIVNLESLGQGTLSYLEREGALRQTACSPRMKRFIRKASQASGVNLQTARVDWRESAASYAMKHRAQAVSIVGMDGGKPAFLGEADDVIENIDSESLDAASDFVVELLRSI